MRTDVSVLLLYILLEMYWPDESCIFMPFCIDTLFPLAATSVLAASAMWLRSREAN